MLKKVERASMDGCKILKKSFKTLVLVSYVNLSFSSTWAMLSEEDYQKHLKNQRQVPLLNTQPIVQAPTTLPQTLADDTLKDSFTDIHLHAIKTGGQGVTLLIGTEEDQPQHLHMEVDGTSYTFQNHSKRLTLKKEVFLKEGFIKGYLKGLGYFKVFKEGNLELSVQEINSNLSKVALAGPKLSFKTGLNVTDLVLKRNYHTRNEEPFCILDKSVHFKNLIIDAGIVQSATDLDFESLSFTNYNAKFINPAYKTLTLSKSLSGTGTLTNYGTLTLKDTFSFGPSACTSIYNTNKIKALGSLKGSLSSLTLEDVRRCRTPLT